MQFFLQNVQNVIFKILKMFKDNTKFTTSACWINSKIRKRDKTPHHESIDYFITTAGHYHGGIIECPHCCRTLLPEVAWG